MQKERKIAENKLKIVEKFIYNYCYDNWMMFCFVECTLN